MRHEYEAGEKQIFNGLSNVLRIDSHNIHKEYQFKKKPLSIAIAEDKIKICFLIGLEILK